MEVGAPSKRDPVGASELIPLLAAVAPKLDQCHFAIARFGATRRETVMADGKFLTLKKFRSDTVAVLGRHPPKLACYENRADFCQNRQGRSLSNR